MSQNQKHDDFVLFLEWVDCRKPEGNSVFQAAYFTWTRKTPLKWMSLKAIKAKKKHCQVSKGKYSKK